MPGNTGDKTTPVGFLEKIEAQYGAVRAGLDHGPGHSDRGDAGGDARGRSAPLLGRHAQGPPDATGEGIRGAAWREVRESVEGMLLAEDGQLYILAQSRPRILKERGMRRRQLKKLWRRLHELRGQSLKRDELLLKLGAAKKEAGRVSPGRDPPACGGRVRDHRRPSPSRCGAPGCVGRAAARAGICCSPT